MSFPALAMRLRRYTRFVGNSPLRAVAVILVAVLGSGPAAAAFCEALCFGGHQTKTVAAATPVTHEGHAAHHDLHQSARVDAVSSGSSGDSPAFVNGSSHQKCCPELVQTPAFMAAGRADTRALPALHAAVLFSATAAGVLHPKLASLTRGAPPGATSPARTPFVFRI